MSDIDPDLKVTQSSEPVMDNTVSGEGKLEKHNVKTGEAPDPRANEKSSVEMPPSTPLNQRSVKTNAFTPPSAKEIQSLLNEGTETREGLPDPIGQLYRFSLASSPLRRGKRPAGGNGSAKTS